jgi:peptidoglycan/xylan/chitin deacetylase (PgdA/CDA1 family)
MGAVRFDRYVTLSVFQPLNKVGFGGAEKCVPILMYHSVSEDAEEGVEPYYRLATHPKRFAEQMQWLHNAGFRGVSLEEAVAALDAGKPEAKSMVAITFDDGFRDFYTAAWPALQKHGFTATMYLPTAFISQKRATFLNRDCMTWNEVRQLRSKGIRFGSHTVNHPKLHESSWDVIRGELSGSKNTIERELNEEISGFAYPYAFPQEDQRFTGTFAKLLREEGYKNCVTTVVGRFRAGDDRLRLKRLPANSCDDEALFTAKLNGAYDWLGSAQRAVRQLKLWSGKTVRQESREAAV